MPRETKSARILDLYARGDFTVREIADAVGCRPEYVRVVARQRKGRESEIDRAYKASPAGTAARLKSQERRLTKYHAVPSDMRKAVRRKAYKKARLAGASVRDARRAGDNAVSRFMHRFGRAEAAHA